MPPMKNEAENPDQPRWKRIASRITGNISRITGKQIGIAIIIVAVVLGLVDQANKKTDDDTTPPKMVELCDELAKPENARLHPSDWRDITDFTGGQIEAYVTVHCPSQLFKVLS